MKELGPPKIGSAEDEAIELVKPLEILLGSASFQNTFQSARTSPCARISQLRIALQLLEE